MKDFPIRFVLTDEAITPSPRLAFIVYLLHQTKLDKRVNELRIPTVRREVHISHSDVIRSMMCLLATGKTDFDHIEAYYHDDIFSASMRIQHVPFSPDPAVATRSAQLACTPPKEGGVRHQVGGEEWKKVKYNQTIKTKGGIFKMIRQFVSIAVTVILVGGILFGIGKGSLANSNQKGIKESGTVTPQSIASKTKTTTIQVGQTVQTLYVTGTFETQYSDVHKRQLFSGVKSISSKASGSGTWIQTGYNAELIDGGRTYVITVSGKYSYNGATYTISTSIEFYCNANHSIG